MSLPEVFFMDVEKYYMWTEKISQREKKEDDLCLEERRPATSIEELD
jgi:hypothetical protein